MLPDIGDFLNEELFVDLQQGEADRLMRQYNKKGCKIRPAPLTTKSVVASGAVRVVVVSSAKTSDAPLGATEEDSRNKGEAATEEIPTIAEMVATTRTTR